MVKTFHIINDFLFGRIPPLSALIFILCKIYGLIINPLRYPVMVAGITLIKGSSIDPQIVYCVSRTSFQDLQYPHKVPICGKIAECRNIWVKIHFPTCHIC